MELNKGLNLSGQYNSAISGQLYYAKNIMLDETFRFLENEYGFKRTSIPIIETICGIIPYTNGCIIFGNTDSPTACILNIDLTNNTVKHNLIIPQITFTTDNPIRGDITYNQKGELIIVFSSGVNGNFEDKIININNYNYTIISSIPTYELTNKEYYKIDLTPNIQFPNINSLITNGSLNTGSYQIAVCYKIDNDYTKYSLLSIPVYIYNQENDSQPNNISNKGIEYTLLNLDINYEYYRVAIIYNDGTSFIVRTTKDLSTINNIFKLDTLLNLDISSLNETLLESVYYSNSETLAIQNNSLYRANLKSNNWIINGIKFDDIAKEISNSLELELISTEINTNEISRDKQYIKFQNDEVYALYLTLGDNKGNVIGSYPIKSKYTNHSKLSNAKTWINDNIQVEKIITDNPYTIIDNIIKNELTLVKQNQTSSDFNYSITTFNNNAYISFNLPAIVTVSLDYIMNYDIEIEYKLTYNNGIDDIEFYGSINIIAGNLNSSDDISSIIPDFDTFIDIEIISTSNLELYELHISSNHLLYTNQDFIFRFNTSSGIVEQTVTILDGTTTNSKIIPKFTYINYTIEYTPLKKYKLTTQYNLLIDTVLEFEIDTIYGLINPIVNILQGTSNSEYIIYHDALDMSITYRSRGIDMLEIHYETILNVLENIGLYLTVNDDFNLPQNKSITLLNNNNISETITVQIDYNSYDIQVTSINKNTDITRLKFKVNELPLEDLNIDIDYTRTGYSSFNVISQIIKYTNESNLSSPFHDTNTFSIIFNSSPTHFIPIELYDYYKVSKEKDIFELEENDDFKYSENYIKITLPLNVESILGDFKDLIGFWCIHRALRNNTNSRIYSQGLSKVLHKQNIHLSKFYNVYPSISPLTEYWNEYLQNYYFQRGYYVNEPARLYMNDDGSYYMKARVLYEPFVYATVDIQLTLLENGKLTDGNIVINMQPLDTDFTLVTTQTPIYNRTIQNNNNNVDLSFTSFEDLFNKSNYCPTYKLENISEYLFQFTEANYQNSLKTIYTNNFEKIKTNIVDVISQSLLPSNNYSIKNLVNNDTRKIRISGTNDIYTTVTDNKVISIGQSLKLYRNNLLNDVTEYYKYLYDESLVLCSSLNIISNIELNCYGDTFYSKFDIYYKQCFIPVDGINDENMFDETITDTYIKNYFLSVLIESKYNIHARFWIGDYPKWEQPINTSTQIGYNKIYNLQNNINKTIVKKITDKNNSDIYISRIIKHNKLNPESNSLGFRNVLALSYYDMPYSKLGIKSLLCTNKNMYIIQELASHIASIKDVLSYDEGTTYIGSGDLFDRLPSEIIPTKYGFINCSSIFNTGICDIGVWIIDSINSRIFLITDNSIEILTDNINEEWFKNKLIGNNPYKNQGCYLIYHNDKRRLILNNSTLQYTLSYIPTIKNWLSFHEYKFRNGININNKPIFFDKIEDVNYISEFDKSVRCKLNNIYESIISVIFNEEPLVNKLFESVIWNSNFILDNVNQYDKTFTKIMIHNNSQCTLQHDIKLNDEWFETEDGVNVKELWLFNNINDYVKDNRKAFLQNFIELINSNINISKDWFDISKFISTFGIVTFIFDNLYYNSTDNEKSLEPTLNHYQAKLLLQNLIIKYLIDNR